MRKFILIIVVLGVLIILMYSCIKKDYTPAVKAHIDPFQYKFGELKEGENLADALMNKGLDRALVFRLVNKLNKIYDLRYSHPKDKYAVKMDSLGNIVDFAFQPDKIHTYRVIPDSTGEYLAKIDTLKISKQISVCEGEIESSLWNAMIEIGEGPALIVMLTQIFQWDIDFFIDPQKGDRFKLVYEKFVNEQNKFVKYGNILVARYQSPSFQETAFRYTTNKGITKYYDETGKCFQKAFLKSPLNYKRITSYFGSRYHPIRKRRIFHNGVDYAASYGTPVEASADGTIIHRGWKGGHPTVNGRKGGYGKTVIIRHSNGYKTLYGHLSSYGKYRVGDRVQQHDVIGYVGSTGLSTGNHLHYTIYHYGKTINPLSLKNVSGPPVPKQEMEEYKKIVKQLKTLLEKDVILANTKLHSASQNVN